MNTKTNISLALSTIAVGFAGIASTATALPATGNAGYTPPPTSHKHVKGVSKASYIKAADSVCSADHVAMAPLKAQLEALTQAEHEAAFPQGLVKPLNEVVTTERVYIQELRRLKRPAGAQLLLVNFINAEIAKGNALNAEAVSIANEEALALSTAMTEVNAGVAAVKSYAAEYGFKVCGQ